MPQGTDAPFFSLHGGTPAPAALLRQAIRKRQVVRMLYRDGAGQPSQRRLRPLAIWSYAAGWMVWGWCELRQDFRAFRFDRIQKLTLTGERFVEDEDTGLQAFLARESCRDLPLGS